MPGCPDSEAKFKAISEAYDCLKDPQKRAAYDRFGHAAFSRAAMAAAGGGGAGFRRLRRHFRHYLRRVHGRRPAGASANVRRGADLRYDLEIRLEDAFHGSDTPIEIEVVDRAASPATASGAKPGTAAATCTDLRRPRQGPRAAGLLRRRADLPELPRRGERDRPTPAAPVAAKAGSTRRKARGQYPARRRRGHPHPPGRRGRGRRPRGAPPGDLYIFLHVSRHPMFEREGTTLFARAPVSFTTAALGGSIEVPGLDGESHEIEIPVGIQSGEAAAPARRRHAGAARPRPRRPCGRGRGRDADQARQGSRRRSSSSSARPRPATRAPSAVVSSTG